jgi:uncharacterized HhH-GPD family protein
MSSAASPRLPYTGDPDADRLLEEDPMAMLVGFLLDQQVTVQKAFSGPLELRRRIGAVDARTIAAVPPERLEEVFRTRPALHRFPASMARRTRELAEGIVARYDGDAARIWSDGADAREVRRRLLELPGMGEMKAGQIMAVLAKRLGIRPPGWEDVVTDRPTLGDVDSPSALAAYQAGKRAAKAELRSRDAR